MKILFLNCVHLTWNVLYGGCHKCSFHLMNTVYVCVCVCVCVCACVRVRERERERESD